MPDLVAPWTDAGAQFHFNWKTLSADAGVTWCFRYLLWVACTHVLLIKAFIPDLKQTTTGDGTIEGNQLQSKILYPTCNSS